MSGAALPENAATQQGGVQTGKALLNAGSNTVLHDGVLAYITHVLAEGEIWHSRRRSKLYPILPEGRFWSF
jgi:hypothetical protein